jgi:hypothetical protein
MRKQRTALPCVPILLLLISCSAAQASKFMRLCEATKAKAAAFLSECKQNARPLKRDFYPGTTNTPVREEHAAWFDTTDYGEHFGLGCVLGPNQQVRFLGLYYFVKPANFANSNLTRLRFIDFTGNVGLRSSDGRSITLLAAHKFTPPGQRGNFTERNCDIGKYNETLDQTVYQNGEWLEFYRIKTDQGVAAITHCLDREIRFLKTQCTTRKYEKFFASIKSPIISGRSSIILSEDGSIAIETGIFAKVCTQGFRSAIEYVNVISELCKL